MTRPDSPATVVSSQIPASKRQGRVAGHGGRHRARGGHRNNEYGLARRTPAGAARTTTGRLGDDSDDSPGFPAPSPVSSLLSPLPGLLTFSLSARPCSARLHVARRLLRLAPNRSTVAAAAAL